MHLRAAVSADEPFLAAICARAFFDDDLFGRVIHPQRNKYPEDVKIYWHETIRQHWNSPRCRVLVAVEDSDVQLAGKIVGMAIWERQGDDTGAHQFEDEHISLDPWPAMESGRNRALDPTKESIIQDAEVFSKHYWTGPRAINYYLVLCCVDPDHQHKGYGRLLAGWGLERARKEGIRASVIASDGSSEFYMKCGFNEIVGNASRAGGAVNPMVEMNVKGGEVLFTCVGGQAGSCAA